MRGTILGERTELDRFFMDDLADIAGYFSDHSDKAYAVVETLACGGDDITESFLALYLGGLDIDSELLGNVLSWFVGLGYLKVSCDCGQDRVFCAIPAILTNMYFSAGEMEKQLNSDHYLYVGAEIASLREKIYT